RGPLPDLLLRLAPPLAPFDPARSGRAAPGPRSPRHPDGGRPGRIALAVRRGPAALSGYRSALAAAVAPLVGSEAMLTLPPAAKIGSPPPPPAPRRGPDGLAASVRSQLQADPLSGHLFVFFNRKADRIKVLYWDRDGMCVWYKRLERGCYHYPPADSGSLELTPGQLQMILDGVDVEHVRRFKRYQRPAPA